MRSRARILSAIFIAVAILLVARLYVVQIIRGDAYARDAMGQYVARAPEMRDRGSIFFTGKEGKLVAAAVMQTGWRVAIDPRLVGDADEAYAKLTAHTSVDRNKFFASASKTSDPYEEVAFRISDETASAIRAERIPGVLLVQDMWRSYPGDSLAAHALGFVGFRGSDKVGVYGLERQWQSTLGEAALGRYVNPFAEIFANIGDLAARDGAARRGDVITSIEPTIQRQLEHALSEIEGKYGPKVSGGIVMDPKSGEIVAMAALPDFNPNTYNTAPDVSVFSNPLVENIYEMGSIMKPLTMAAAIDTGTISPSTAYEDTGCIERSGKKVCNFDGKARGRVSMQEVLNQSLNLGATFAAETMGQTVFAGYIHRFGLGEKTGIDLPNESVGSIKAIEKGSDVDYASASFGQGIAVSPVAMTRALASLANDGNLAIPHVATAIRYQSGISRQLDRAEQKQVLKPESAHEITQMLVTAFDAGLLRGALRQEHYSIAAKTGTAQIAIPGGGGYYPDRYLHSFFGYFPAHDARFIIFLFALEPQRANFASDTLARPFLELAKFLINYYEIAPDR